MWEGQKQSRIISNQPRTGDGNSLHLNIHMKMFHNAKIYAFQTDQFMLIPPATQNCPLGLHHLINVDRLAVRLKYECCSALPIYSFTNNFGEEVCNLTHKWQLKIIGVSLPFPDLSCHLDSEHMRQNQYENFGRKQKWNHQFGRRGWLLELLLSDAFDWGISAARPCNQHRRTHKSNVPIPLRSHRWTTSNGVAPCGTHLPDDMQRCWIQGMYL